MFKVKAKASKQEAGYVAPSTKADIYDKQLKEVFGVVKAPNANLENCAIMYFNMYKSLISGQYKLDSWADLQQHLNSVGQEKSKEELKMVEAQGWKVGGPTQRQLRGKIP